MCSKTVVTKKSENQELNLSIDTDSNTFNELVLTDFYLKYMPFGGKCVLYLKAG